MRTRLFHTIVVCGATLGVAAACSGDGDGDSKTNKNDAGCTPHAQLTTPGSAAGDQGLAGVGDDGGTVLGCGGWPPTK